MSVTKTNAMRMLDAAKIPYEVLTYAVDENDLSGVHIPVDREIDLRPAAALTGNKRIEMVHVKDLLSLTGYIRGGCSPVGMKKKFPTYFDESVLTQERITVSAGVRGAQLLVEREALLGFVGAKIATVTK